MNFLNWADPSGNTMALEFTQSLTEMNTRGISWDERRTDFPSAFNADCKSVSLNLHDDFTFIIVPLQNCIVTALWIMHLVMCNWFNSWAEQITAEHGGNMFCYRRLEVWQPKTSIHLSCPHSCVFDLISMYETGLLREGNIHKV